MPKVSRPLNCQVWPLSCLQAINMATNAYLAWGLGPNFTIPLGGIMSTPKPGSALVLDFASLLGPLFYCWLAQLLLPIMLVTLVYEKEKRCGSCPQLLNHQVPMLLPMFSYNNALHHGIKQSTKTFQGVQNNKLSLIHQRH